MRMVLPLLMVAALAACHRSPGAESAPRRAIGSFSYRINFGSQNPIDGVISIDEDTVTLEADGQPCRRESVLTGSQRSHPFSCFPPPGLESFELNIDSTQPALSTWSAIQIVRKTRVVCVRYTTTRAGTQICAETRNEMYFENVKLGGRLRMTRGG